MLYRFSSVATEEKILLREDGDVILEILGRPRALAGALTPEQLPQAIQVLQAAAVAAQRVGPPAGASEPSDADGDEPVSLRQRVIPLIELFKRALAAGETVVWTV